MSDLLTHWAVFEDCRRLAQQDPAIEPLLARLIHEEREFARLGAISRGGSRWVPEILTRAREQWSGTVDTTLLARKVAFALGGITHFPADLVLKPLMSELVQADWNAAHHQMQRRPSAEGTGQDTTAIKEISVYYDVHVFREVYLSGHEEPFNRFLIAANATEPGKALEEFVRALFQRALLASHTLDPDSGNIEQWLDRLFAKVQPLYLDIDLYTRVFASPDPEKVERYKVETEFYRASDPIVQAARALQRGQSLSPAEIEQALTAGKNQGGYGRALEIGMRCLRDASAYWRGEASQPPDLRQSVHWAPKQSSAKDGS